MSTATISVVESDTSTGLYDMLQGRMVVDHPTHGRLLLVEGFGGMDSLQGGQYRWMHGYAVRLQPGDTLASLDLKEWNEWTSLYTAVMAGYDKTRPVLEWSGHMIASVARAAR
jgi:hypothetical protein